MKLTRKLIPAFAMLLIAAVMMSTASFAWFSMSTEVDATGMNVTATTPASLEISADGTTGWAYSVTPTTASAEGLHPITLFDGKWYVPSSTNKIGLDGNAEEPNLNADTIANGKWTEITLDTDTGVGNDSKKYALVSKLYLRTNAGTDTTNATPIKFDAMATKSGSSALMNGVKVYILDGGTYYDITGTTNCPTDGWEAPVTGSKMLTVVVVYDGQLYSSINNTNADLLETNITIDFNAAG